MTAVDVPATSPDDAHAGKVVHPLGYTHANVAACAFPLASLQVVPVPSSQGQ